MEWGGSFMSLRSRYLRWLGGLEGEPSATTVMGEVRAGKGMSGHRLHRCGIGRLHLERAGKMAMQVTTHNNGTFPMNQG